MKRILSLAAVLLAAMLFLTGCEKHAFTISTNIFRYTSGRTTKTVYQDLDIKAGKTIYIFAATKDKDRFTDGHYTVSINNGSEEDHYNPECVSAEPGTQDGLPCIVLKGVSRGKASVSLNFYINDFHLYKTVEVTVK